MSCPIAQAYPNGGMSILSVQTLAVPGLHSGLLEITACEFVRQ